MKNLNLKFEHYASKLLDILKLKQKYYKFIIKVFHKIYYYNTKNTWSNTYWYGVPVKKCPLDLWIYQEILYEIKPDIIIEAGTAAGGSALFLANICDLINKGKIFTIDIRERKNQPNHKRIEYLIGSSISREIFEYIEQSIKKEDIVLVILDSDHSKDHVLKELEIYHKFVTKGSYLIVEDTNLNNHPVLPTFGLGPWEAVEVFLKTNKNFIADKKREKFYMTFNPNGYLKRIP